MYKRPTYFMTIFVFTLCVEILPLFPGLPTVQFLIACSMEKRRGRPGPFYHVNDPSVYLGNPRGGQVLC